MRKDRAENFNRAADRREIRVSTENEEKEPENEAEEDTKEEKEQRSSITETGMVVTKRGDISISSLTVIGQIEGHYILSSQNKTTKYEHIIPHLVAIEENPEIDGLLIILNTAGGDVEAGLAISEMISSMKKPTVSLVIGGGHSIGVPLAVSAKHSFIVPSATMTVHPVRMNGLVIGTEQSFNYFSKMQERINRFVLSHSNVKEAELNRLMFNTGELSADVGSLVDGSEAIEIGLIDEIGGLSAALEKLRDMCRAEKRKGKRKKSAEPKTNRG